MKENEVAALVRGLAPGIRQVVAEATTPLIGRLTELEARPIENGDAATAPDDVAAKVANAARMLAEAPPICREAEARATEIITQKGEPGVRGLPGLPGPQGERGERGEPGPRGRDGTGIAGAAISRDGELLLTLSDGVILTLALDKVMDNV